MESIYSTAIHCVFDQIPNLQNCFTTPRGLRQINTCRQVNFKEKPTFKVWRLYRYLVHGAGASNPAHAVKGVNKIQQVQSLIEVKHKIYQRCGGREEEGRMERTKQMLI